MFWVVLSTALIAFATLFWAVLPRDHYDGVETLPIENAVGSSKRTRTTNVDPPSFLQRKRSCLNTSVVISSRIAPTSDACCAPVEGDIDTGLTLSHLMKKYYCTATLLSRRRMRIVQVGANTGDNANDHLVKFLKTNVADAVLLEPVPWIFKRLETTYKNHREMVTLVNAAMSEKDGVVSFQAPDERARGWDVQRGGINLPPSSVRALKKTHKMDLFKTITVDSTTFQSLLAQMKWIEQPPPENPIDVFVVDAEGYDAVIVGMVLDTMIKVFGPTARIPILQYEWKHISKDARESLKARLVQLGYCVHQVHYDDVAVLPPISKGGFRCAESFDLG